ncbi:glycerophosphocholine phosphodiesteras-like protein Gde1 [Lophiostoma macrostomum CBS 122681]|uniref:Glycerophosphocholine phosphodiesteras-like protein Gde1 n=1 Tax=Lophiostoma macrostomum CBS 122681 TaxID=1314788 RepID=A0A6A6SYL5_9PLEO|nr:glycerophosphocholine phosphodiesteras-like protein Gde1 [Lophiostoma macrostomum CBS 122681]
MKFGHNLPRNQVPEWASSYIDYKHLKKLIKIASADVKNGQDQDLAGKHAQSFFFALDRNLEDVDGFYGKKYAEFSRRLKLLHGRYGRTAQGPDGLDKDEAQDVMGALLELRGQLRKLQWYGEVNRRGFIKITKKLDKKIPRVCTQQRYLSSKVDPKPFAHNLPLSQDMRAVNEWLSAMGDAKTFDDTASSHSAASLGRAPARALNLSPGTLDAIEQAIRNDNAQKLSDLLAELSGAHDPASDPYQQLLLNFLQRSISSRAEACIDRILPDITSLEEDDDINKRNCIHRLILNIGRSKSGEGLGVDGVSQSSAPETSRLILPAAPPKVLSLPTSTTESGSITLLTRNDESVRLLIYLLGKLQPRQRSSLEARDAYGRMPLHYAAQYGFVTVCQVVIEHMYAWGQFSVAEEIDSSRWRDAEGYAPLHLAVIGGHPLATKALLQTESWLADVEETFNPSKKLSQSGAVLALATQANFAVIVRLLVAAGVDVNYRDEQGETALHVAARFGHENCAKALLEGSVIHKADVNVPEKTYGWTPLFIACVDGHLPVGELLLAAGADLERCDLSGWTAKEHAALRGHMDIVARLAEVVPIPRLPETNASSALSSSPPPTSSLEERKSKKPARENSTLQKGPEPVKTFGHRYLTHETLVLVSLGTMDIRKDIPAVILDDIPIANAHATQLDTALSLVVSASGATGEPTVIDLPVQDNICTEPITFMTTDATKVKLLFDIVPTYAGSNDRIVGRGVALLSSIKPSIGSQRITLQGDIKVPIVAATTLDVIGSINFNFLIITPFSHPNMTITSDHTYWKKMASTMVIGHRGLGKNTGSRTSLQLGENTLQSFIAAANLGAAYVEFDVQLTKDHVPVIYHDFLVSETGIDAPVHLLTLEQFLHVSEGQTPRESRPTSPVETRKSDNGNGTKQAQRRMRSYSVDISKQKNIHTHHSMELTERMKHTRDFKIKGYKGNSRGNFIQAPFTTLEEMFKKLPESTGFNIEMKYPMLHESEEHEMDQYAVELNSFVDTVLKTVYDLAGDRNVIFSSFNPDICLMLSFKQPSIPILFLTDAGTSPVGDVRAASLQEAIRFASRWNLLGVVSAADPLVKCPRLVRVVKESGLVCVSYGTLNNDPQNVQLQSDAGIDAVIVDSVIRIREGLRASDQRTPAQATNGTNDTAGTASNPTIPPTGAPSGSIIQSFEAPDSETVNLGRPSAITA